MRIDVPALMRSAATDPEKREVLLDLVRRQQSRGRRHVDSRRRKRENRALLEQQKAEALIDQERVKPDFTAEWERCKADKIYWFNKYVEQYDPRRMRQLDPKTGKRLSPYFHVELWPKQVEMVAFIDRLIDAQEEGLIEKSRDTGASYIFMGVLLHHWLFDEGFKGTVGSRELDLVDDGANPDSLFGKLRIMVHRLPLWMLPDGFNRKKHDTAFKLENPGAEPSFITGEGGAEMGRGGRSTVYGVDEAAFVPKAEATEASLSGNTDCVIWISSVNGMGNLFARKRHETLPEDRVFRIHYTDDPRKTPEWAVAKKASMTDPTKWASEYEIDYHASVEGICIPAAWVRACQQIAIREPSILEHRLPFGVGGLDVGGGKAKSVFIPRHGPIVSGVHSRGDPDTTGTAYWGLALAQQTMCSLLNYDAPGIGAGVASTLEANLVREESGQTKPSGVKAEGVNTGLPPSRTRVWPDERTSYDTFGNLKAECWWLCREAAKRTYEYIRYLDGDPEGVMHPLADLLSLPSQGSDAAQLANELSVVKYFRNEAGKLVIETKVQLSKRGIRSPDYADALVLTFVDPPPTVKWYVGK